MVNIWKHILDFAISGQGFTNVTTFGRGVYTPGVGWQSTQFTQPQDAIWLERYFGTTFDINSDTRVRISSNLAGVLAWYVDGVLKDTDSISAVNNEWHSLPFTGPCGTLRLDVTLNAGGLATIHELELHGIGINPILKNSGPADCGCGSSAAIDAEVADGLGVR